MTSLQPRPPYSPEELQKLYPAHLRLQLVQIFFRHGIKTKCSNRVSLNYGLTFPGERTPEHVRFENTGLPALWPYCNSARHMISAVKTTNDPANWTGLEWHRHIERLGNVSQSLAKNPKAGALDSTCNLSELTEKGRRTTLDLGRRLRHLYVHQLGFLPETISRPDTIRLRASPFPRALHSVQQAFIGLYPAGKRAESFPRPTIVTRMLTEETLMPNEDYCQRFMELSKAFSQRTADRWNKSSEMSYLSTLIQRWMPSQQRVAVDSNPRLHGIWDSINSTLATTPGNTTLLPREFYDARARKIIEPVVVEEEYSGYKESREYRTVGIGALLGEVVQRILQSSRVHLKGDSIPKLTLAGCHDSTVAAILASLGALEGANDVWPAYTSSLAVELFQSRLHEQDRGLPSNGKQEPGHPQLKPQNTIGSYVRIRYNDRPIVIPGCKIPGHHLEGNDSFCTLAAFKEIVDKFTPSDWKQACLSNLGKPAFPVQKEPAGF